MSPPRITRSQLAVVVRRLLVIAALFVYIAVSFNAAIESYNVLHGVQSPLTVYFTNRATLITDYAGSSRIRDSRLLREVLGDSTAPRDDTLYLESLTLTSFTSCSLLPSFDTTIYGNDYLRSEFQTLVARGAYNLTFLPELKLIAPIVDCTFPPVIEGDKSHARIFYLVRAQNDPDDVAILTFSVAVQNYVVTVQHQEGPAMVATFSLISDMGSSTPVQHYFAVAVGRPYELEPGYDVYSFLGETSSGQRILESIPRNIHEEESKVMLTSTLKGFFITAPTAQANTKQMNWKLDTDRVSVLSIWKWQGRTLARDSWAWVHFIHGFFGLSTLFDQLFLFLIMYRNYRLGKIWIGDAFASVSQTLVFRGAAVLVTCYFNEYWTLLELCYTATFEVAAISPPLYANPSIGHADLLTLYLCTVDFLGYLSKTRIDPAFSVLVFEAGFALRVLIVKAFPAILKDFLIKSSTELYEAGNAPIDANLAECPFRLWTANRLPKSQLFFLLASAGVALAVLLAVAVVYVVLRKLYLRNHPSLAYTSSVKSRKSASRSMSSSSPKTSFTLFETATGAELQNRFGVIGDYDNFVFLKGMKFASADGIYCNGFVIANGKFLVATEDIRAIILMKLLRTRLRNVYTYEVDGSKLKQTAQLVYPHTLSWADLLKLNVSILS